MRRTAVSFGAALAFVAAFLGCSAKPKIAKAPPISAQRRAEQFEIFQTVWMRIHDKHFDPKFNGVDWDEVRERYAAKIPAVANEDEFYRVVNEMLGELRQTHLGLMPAGKSTDARPESPSEAGNSATTGIVLDWVEGLPTVTRVRPGSPAERAGIGTGWTLLAVGGREVTEKGPLPSEESSIPSIYRLRALQSRLNGKAGSSVRLRMETNDGAKEVEIPREMLLAEKGTMLGFPVEVEFESRTVGQGVSYLRFNLFATELLPRIQESLRKAKDSRGIILDLRGNPGGVGMMVSPIAAYLFAEKTELGTMLMREGELRFPVFPKSKPFLGPVMLLTDGGSASTSEVLAGSLQELGRVTVIGERTAGAVLPSSMEILADGSVLQFVVADYKTPKGTYLEGRGVIPDRVVKPTRKALLEGKDTALDAALEEIETWHKRKEGQ